MNLSLELACFVCVNDIISTSLNYGQLFVLKPNPARDKCGACYCHFLTASTPESKVY